MANLENQKLLLVFVTPWTETSVAIQGLCFGMKI